MLSKRQLLQARSLIGRPSFVPRVPMMPSLLQTSAYGFAHKDNFLQGSNANYIDHMYEQWKHDPKSVNASWQAFFATDDFQVAPTLGQTARDAQLDEILKILKTGGGHSSAQVGDSAGHGNVDDAINLFRICRAYMAYGHNHANLDPLNIEQAYANVPSMLMKYRCTNAQSEAILDYKTYGFTEADLEKTYRFKVPFKGAIAEKSNDWKLKDLIEAYKSAYAKNIGVEFMHIVDMEKRNWIRQKFEALQYNPLTKQEKLKLYQRINETHAFANFIAQKFNTMKRFGIEGCESFIPGLKFCMDKATEQGARTFIIGMPHRGRLNCLANVVKKSKEAIFAEFQGAIPQAGDGEVGAGDVKYHLGTTLHRTYGEKKVPVKITLLANPSHLEAINPVVIGRARAEQHFQ